MSKQWPKVKLGEVVSDLTEARTFHVQPDDVIVDPTIQSAAHKISAAATSHGFEIKVNKRILIKLGDLVFSRFHTQNGAFAFSEGNFQATGTFLPLRIHEEKADRRFLFWTLHKFVPSLSASDTVGRETYKTGEILKLEIPLPPLAEQRRIVARIEEVVAQIDEARTHRHQAAEETEALLTSTISAKIIFASELVAHQLSPLKGVCELITDGAHNTPRYVEEGVPLLTAKNVFWDRIDTDNVRHISREEHEPIYRRCPVRRGDVLFINIGATTGTARKVDFDMEFSVKNVAMLRADARQLDGDFLIYLLRGPTVRDQIAKRQAQTCQQFLALRDIRNLKVPIPPLSEQRRIVAELDALQAEVDQLKTLQAETAAELDALLPAILDRAFKGEL